MKQTVVFAIIAQHLLLFCTWH